MKQTIFLGAILLSGLCLTSGAEGQRRKTPRQTQPKPAPSKPAPKKPARTYEAVVLIVRPDSWARDDAEFFKKKLEAMNFKVRSIDASNVKEDELQCDVIIKIDVDMEWDPGKTLDSMTYVAYGVIAPRLNKRDKWQESAAVRDLQRPALDRYLAAREKAISWIRENVVSK